MIDWLIRVGRALVVLCAMITIIACAIQGYILANIYYQTTLMEDGTAASGPVFGALLLVLCLDSLRPSSICKEA
jgi:ABC-type transport system involved in cytochrome bd biosynthesis fused ATPase/permease subunit